MRKARAAIENIAFRELQGGAVPALFGFSLFEQRQHALRNLVGLRHHGGAGLLQDLGAREVGGFLGKVGIHDAPTGGREVLVG